MLNFQYRRVLQKVASVTFPNDKILPFTIEIYPKEMKSKHGDYNSRNRVIRIFNLSQRVDYTISTALHELAHHCEYSLYGDTGHTKRFYKVFKALLETAISFGIVEYDVIRTQENASDLKMLEKHFGPVTIIAKSVVQDEESVIKVGNSYTFRNELKENSYFYDTVEKAWGKCIPTSLLSEEIGFLSQYTDQDNIIIRSLYDLSFQAIYYVFITGGYEVRETLKENGYFYKTWKKKKGWAKKIISTELDKEKIFLQGLKITDFSVVSQFV